MKLSDFDTKLFTRLDEISLSDWVICKDHYPKVVIYQKNDTLQWFQVSLKHKKFRQTPHTEGNNAILPYGEWQELDSEEN